MSTSYYIPPAIKKVNYLNNRDMLKELHRSKSTYCEFDLPEYAEYDCIVESVDDIFNPDNIAQAKIYKAARASQSAYEAELIRGTVKIRPIDFKVDPSTIPVEGLIFRVRTYEHIPLAPGRKKTPKSTSDHHIKVNFHPFKHYIIRNNEAIEVGRSHFHNGKFSLDNGYITDNLARMFLLLVNKIAQSGNWRGYTYLDEMKGQAMLQLSQMGLCFDEYKSDNPFAYYTAAINHSFTRVLNIEKKNQKIRDDLLIDSGAMPSFTRQLEISEETRKTREAIAELERFGAE